MTPDEIAMIQPPRGLPLLGRGAHPDPSRGACLMEATALLAGEAHTDHPASVHPVLAALARVVNDAVSDQTRQALLLVMPRLIGTADSPSQVTGQLVVLCCQRALPAALPIWGPRLRRDLYRLRRGRTVSTRHAVGTATRAAASLALSDPQNRDRLLVELVTDALTLVEEHSATQLRAIPRRPGLADAVPAHRPDQRSGSHLNQVSRPIPGDHRSHQTVGGNL